MFSDIPVKIEDRELPKDLRVNKSNSRSGFLDIIFLSSIVSTSILWAIIILVVK